MLVSGSTCLYYIKTIGKHSKKAEELLSKFSSSLRTVINAEKKLSIELFKDYQGEFERTLFLIEKTIESNLDNLKVALKDFDPKWSSEEENGLIWENYKVTYFSIVRSKEALAHAKKAFELSKEAYRLVGIA